MGTGQIRKRFEQYALLVLDIDRQCDRLAEMEESALSPATASWSDVPASSGVPGDRVGRSAELMEMQRIRVADAITREREERNILSGYLTCLTPDERAIVERFYFDLQTCEVIAERMELSDRGVRNIRDRAFRRLEEAYAEKNGNENC